MKYKGRIVGITSSLIAYFLVHYIVNNKVNFTVNITIIGHIVIIGVLTYLFGMQYDKIKCYSQRLEKEREKLNRNYEELEHIRNELQLIFDNVNVVIWSIDLVKKSSRVSKGITKLLGISNEELEKKPDIYRKFIYSDDNEIYAHSLKKMFSERTSVTQQYRIVKRNGDILWVEESITPLLDSKGNIIKINGVITDITSRKEMEDAIKNMAYFDSLTGLANRYMLNQYLDKALIRSKHNKSQLAIMFLDLDNFKAVNDTLGHEAGDLLLKKISEILKRTIRVGDTVSRQGGDEFIILLEDIDQKEVFRIAKKILGEFCTSFQIYKEEFFISPSIGISLYPQHGDNGQILIKHADDAMYFAKKFGKNSYKLYTPNFENINDLTFGIPSI